MPVDGVRPDVVDHLLLVGEAGLGVLPALVQGVSVGGDRGGELVVGEGLASRLR